MNSVYGCICYFLGTSNQHIQGEEEEEDDDDEVEEVQPRRAKLTAFKDCNLNGRSQEFPKHMIDCFFWEPSLNW
jgi:hypothetical protein